MSLSSLLHTPAHELASLAAVAVRGGQIVAEAYHGRRTIHPTDSSRDLPVTAETRFRVASISKSVAALGLMRLVEMGQADLDADISRYLPFVLRHPQHPHHLITLRHLLSHTSGLRDGAVYTIPLPHVLQDCFTPGTPFYEGGAHWGTAAPGTFFCYSNLNFGVLATAVENITGQRFDLYMREAVFAPLGIRASYNVALFTAEEIGNLATLYRKCGADGVWNPAGPWVAQVDDYGGRVPLPLPQIENPDTAAAQPAIAQAPLLDRYQIGTNGTIFSPQGGLRISARELAVLMQLFLRGGAPLLQPSTTAELWREQWQYQEQPPNGDSFGGLMRCWGLGFQKLTHTQGGDRPLANATPAWMGHMGSAYGLLSGWWFDPYQQQGLIYIIGGTGADFEQYPGYYSAFSRWEEAVFTELWDEIDSRKLLDAGG